MELKDVEKVANIQENWFVFLIGACLVYGLSIEFAWFFVLLILFVIFLFIVWLLGGGFKWIKTKLLK